MRSFLRYSTLHSEVSDRVAILIVPLTEDISVYQGEISDGVMMYFQGRKGRPRDAVWREIALLKIVFLVPPTPLGKVFNRF